MRDSLFRSRFVSALISSFLFLTTGASVQAFGQDASRRTPTETVQQFYQLLREKNFRGAFALSIFKPAIDDLSAEDFDDLKVDFERMSANVPEKIEYSGEQVSGETASVFIKAPGAADSDQPEPVPLMRIGNQWIIGDKDTQAAVKQEGRNYFLKARIDTHHKEAAVMLQRVNLAEIAYSAQHNGQFADIPVLLAAGLLPKDIETTESTGYKFHLTLAKDAKSYTVGAEPARYGRTGRFSYFMDKDGIKNADVGGKPLILSEIKKP
ncbi:MAG: hypothetical protein WCB68_22120 [Pyrinomonadaceae bacterium]